MSNIFDILGPVMVGPSSSHTAGAVRIGYITRVLLGEEPIVADIGLYGSFSSTGKGHGTDRALVAGLLGMHPDDIRIPQSFELAREAGLDFAIHGIQLQDAHPNTAVIEVTGKNHKKLSVESCSIGGGRIRISKLDGITVNCSGESPTLIVHNIDQPGHVAEVTSMMAKCEVNIATMQLYRDKRGGYAVMVIETDQQVPEEKRRWLENLDGVIKVTYIDGEEI
ncbi:MAG: L-serine ammonia-lyase, iron-sulfur-dependent subunit beta [Hespellia sp.]|nr:L-serine ammonia-lyase, iron-sulfur-dependent subunit beta [Hespellia sp.]